MKVMVYHPTPFFFVFVFYFQLDACIRETFFFGKHIRKLFSVRRCKRGVVHGVVVNLV